MRLTLRTLLAYLDDILDPADARELGKKIEESDFASGLVHRIRSVTRKLRLGTPKLAGKGMGLDANTVAEYLDNTLPQDRIPDFEKVCLESDVQLAEVASCHQILTLVLGEPADVDPALRERIRELCSGSEGQELASPGDANGPPPVGTPVPPPVDARTGKWDDTSDLPLITAAPPTPENAVSSVRLLPVVGTLFVAFLLALVALIAIGPLDHDHPIVGRFFADATQGDRSKRGTDRRARGDAGARIVNKQTSPSGPGGASTESKESRAAQGPGVDSPSAPATKTLDDGRKAPRGAPPETGPAKGSAFPPLGDKRAGAPATPLAKTGGGETAAPSRDGPAPVPSIDETGAMKTAPGKIAPAAPAKIEPVARYTSDMHVLARFNRDTGSWLRLPTNILLAAGDRLVAFPTYRPQITLGSNIQVTIVGPAALRLLEPTADGVPCVALEYGRFLATANGQAGARLDLQIGPRRSRTVLRDLESSFALEVRKYLPPGKNPEENQAYTLIAAHAVTGRFSWQDQSVLDPIVVQPQQQVVMIDTEPADLETGAEPPAWIDVRNERPIDRDASKQLEPMLELDQPLSVSLQEQVTNRLIEVQTLAIHSLSQFDEFDPFINALNNRRLYSYWNDLFAAMRDAVARSPETAAKVRGTLERLRGEEGAVQYRLLWGYTPQQLVDGAAETLVQYLASPSMDIRVLAIENLNLITGKTLLFRAEREPKQMKRSFLKWQQSLERGEIKYKTPPLEPPIKDEKPATAARDGPAS